MSLLDRLTDRLCLDLERNGLARPWLRDMVRAHLRGALLDVHAQLAEAGRHVAAVGIDLLPEKDRSS